MESEIQTIANRIAELVNARIEDLKGKQVNDQEFVQEVRRISFMEIAHNILRNADMIKTKKEEPKPSKDKKAE